MGIKVFLGAYEQELALLEDRLADLFKSNVFLIPLVGKHLLNAGGKRIRPLFLLAGARLSGYKGDEHILLASIIEAIHTASLLHDDVVDGAQIRRGNPAAHSIWGNQVVILVGDYLYSNALKAAVDFKNQQIMEALSMATTSMAEGEVLQLQKSSDTGITEEEYLRIVSAKTGILISAACKIGAVLGRRSHAEVNALAKFGLLAGTAYQVADDILDYRADEEGLGKKLGQDLEEGKVTLPLIYLLKAASEPEKQEVEDIIKKGPSEGGLKRILSLFSGYAVLEQAMAKAGRLVEDAKAELLIFPDNDLRAGMFELAEFVLLRRH